MRAWLPQSLWLAALLLVLLLVCPPTTTQAPKHTSMKKSASTAQMRLHTSLAGGEASKVGQLELSRAAASLTKRRHLPCEAGTFAQTTQGTTDAPDAAHVEVRNLHNLGQAEHAGVGHLQEGKVWRARQKWATNGNSQRVAQKSPNLQLTSTLAATAAPASPEPPPTNIPTHTHRAQLLRRDGRQGLHKLHDGLAVQAARVDKQAVQLLHVHAGHHIGRRQQLAVHLPPACWEGRSRSEAGGMLRDQLRGIWATRLRMHAVQLQGEQPSGNTMHHPPFPKAPSSAPACRPMSLIDEKESWAKLSSPSPLAPRPRSSRCLSLEAVPPAALPFSAGMANNRASVGTPAVSCCSSSKRDTQRSTSVQHSCRWLPFCSATTSRALWVGG